MTRRAPFAYVAVAGACLLLHNIVIIGADSVGAPLWLGVLLSFGLVAAAGYVLHSLFTFRRPIEMAAFARYAFAMSVNIPLAFVTTWLFHEHIGLAMPIAAPLASIVMLAANYALGWWAISPARRTRSAARP